ncbi:uridine kinase [Rhodococcus rhodnii]|uniref:Uridine kinase n=2 Tax=Rhodococcus rhodnii TaxID=38312 RepID=R7WKP7_9NOCA|nr:hypothetical protein [Rhodococcus rhodnii]EOM75873.1 hypothetical protein Rrhod_2785 [Rhodococcus rhodnii LMG 5362]TXG91042.1 uridine kinase [Rhodococcus rhodnii]
MVLYRPTTRSALAREVAGRARLARPRAVVAVSAPDAARPGELAAEIADAEIAEGGSADVVDLHDYVRPASLRLEYGHRDELSYRTAWFDYAGLDREVVRALHDRGEWLPRLWDERTDRSAREHTVAARGRHTLVVFGPMLLGQGLGFDVTVRLAMTERTLRRLTDDEWTVAPLLAADKDAPPADVEVRWDHPDRPAVRTGTAVP